MTTEIEKTGRILVVDDELAICRVVTRSLERNGFEAASVSNAIELERILTRQTFDVVLLDRSVSAGAQDSLVSFLRAAAKEAKILFFTGEFVDQSELDLVDGVVQKPINGKDLADTLRALLGERAQDQ